MGTHQHAQAFAEINNILTKAIPGQAIRVLSVDTAVHTDQHVTRARQITPKGGAGTNMATGITTAARTPPRSHHRHHRRLHPLAPDPPTRRPLRHRRAH